MNEAKKEQISAFMDGETDGRHQTQVSQMLKDPELMGVWSRYHLISDCLKQYMPNRIDKNLAENISISLRKEPAIIAPDRHAHPYIKPVAGFAIAASVAALAIFGIQQQQLGGPHEIPEEPLVQTVPGAGNIYAPVRQVSSAGGELTSECDSQRARDSQADSGNGKQAAGNSTADGETAVNCR